QCFKSATAAKHLGINMFLAPILDVVTGLNPWLAGRTLGRDIEQVSRIGAAYVRGVQRAGVIAVAKHFPGYPDLAGDPALDQVSLSLDESELWRHAKPFRHAVVAGVKAMMMGPAPVAALDRHHSASLSPKVIRALKD